MRWKLIRRRLSISAPRMTIRSHLPWPVRWAVVAVVFGFSAALALWAFEFGKQISGFGPARELELQQLRQDLAKVQAERDRAQTDANAADGLIKAGQATQERLGQELSKAEAQVQSLQADLAFFNRLLPAGDQPIQVRALQAESQSPGQTRYQMLVMQSGKNVAEFEGRYDILLRGLLDGAPWKATLKGGPQALKLRQYTRVEGLIDHPPQLVLKAVQATVTDAKGIVRATQTLPMSPEPTRRQSTQ